MSGQTCFWMFVSCGICTFRAVCVLDGLMPPVWQNSVRELCHCPCHLMEGGGGGLCGLPGVAVHQPHRRTGPWSRPSVTPGALSCRTFPGVPHVPVVLHQQVFMLPVFWQVHCLCDLMSAQVSQASWVRCDVSPSVCSTVTAHEVVETAAGALWASGAGPHPFGPGPEFSPELGVSVWEEGCFSHYGSGVYRVGNTDANKLTGTQRRASL